MLRTSDKRAWLPTTRLFKTPDLAGLGAPGIASAMDGEVDWGRVSPPKTANLVGWYDAYDWRTIGMQGQSLGSAFSIWLNKASTSGNSFLSQGVGVSRPIFGSRRIGPYWAVDFDGSTSYMDSEVLTATQVPARPMTMMVVASMDSVSTTNRFLLNGVGNNRLGLYVNGTTGKLDGLVVNVAAVTGTLSVSTGIHVLGAAVSATQFNFLVDGTLAAVSNSSSTSAGQMRVGYYSGGGAPDNLFDGAIGEILIWNVELNSTEMGENYRYLKAKWGTP